ncbi:ABC transporter ATP-binding protein [Burkholderia cenocepacia]|uniref:ABC transporter ATP-binding protein n=1 Tax=Burkholderia cenocepacia TaxID=95486 RepID=UPI0004819C9A|nr:ABC transporter ATP-binding protein [Burkholderia cenocepacia]MBR7996359.1 ABC transporter ATP-binding protein [Burkholderia cenocepacia]
MTPPLLDARHLTLSYDGERRNTVLADVSLSVDRGEIVALIGPSGTGKSSLLRALAGLERPQSGTVSIDGTTLQGPHPRIAIAFQDPCLLPWLSTERNVAFGLAFEHQERLTPEQQRERVRAALHAVGLEAAASLRPAQLSGGMAQRAALARALARQPHALLLDEPFSALDEVTRAAMQQLLVNIVATTRCATVLVTHDIDEALLLADRIVLLGMQGRFINAWHVDYPHPRDAFVSELGRMRIDILKALRAGMKRPHASDLHPLN